MSPFRSLSLPPSEFSAFRSSWWVHGCLASWDQINKGLVAQHQPESHIQPKFNPNTTFLQLPQASMSYFSHMSDCKIWTLFWVPMIEARDCGGAARAWESNLADGRVLGNPSETGWCRDKTQGLCPTKHQNSISRLGYQRSLGLDYVLKGIT